MEVVNIDWKGKGKGDGLVWISIDQSFIRDEDQGNRNATQRAHDGDDDEEGFLTFIM